MFTQRILLDDDYKLSAVIMSHGWYQLLPFRYAEHLGVLSRVHQLGDGRIVRIHIEQASNSSRKNFLLVQTEGDVFPTDHAEIDAIVRRILNLDWRINRFYEFLEDFPEYDWVEAVGAGYILRAPTVWEDLAKTLMTTNITWRQTVTMCEKMVTLGTKTQFGDYLFPTPQQIAALDVGTLTGHIGAGYRGAYLHTLATQIVEREVHVESWTSPVMDGETLFDEVIALKGYGEYAAGSMMRLLGFHNRLSIDSVARQTFSSLYRDGEPAPDRDLHYHYARYGEWQGLVLWMDIMRDYYVKE